MDALTESALVGTARKPDAALTTGTAIDALASALDAARIERRILLAAGAMAVYRMAGEVPAEAPPPPAPCPPESRPLCPPGAAHLLASLFGTPRGAVLVEGLGRLARAGYVLPPPLLVVALSTRADELRTALRPVLGERGRWLAHLNPAWQWAEAEPGDALPPDAEQIWQEGGPDERLDVFRRLRLADPARAREWLAAVWSSEKAEQRGDLIALLSINLSPDDEAALETALADRAASVRASARSPLARLSTSAFAQRMRERADALLAIRGSTLTLTPPRRLDDAWKRDGIAEPPPHGLGKGAWWAMQVLSLVPPAHWQAMTQREPAELIAALPADDAPLLVESWSQAALLHGDAAWMPALWDWWRRTDAHQSAPASENLAQLLFARTPREAAEQRILHELRYQAAGWEEHLPTMLARLPVPWSAPIARAYLDGLRARVARLSGDVANQDWSDPFFATIGFAGVAIPLELAPLALEPVTLPDSAAYIIRHWSERLAAFAETLALRQRIREEIPA